MRVVKTERGYIDMDHVLAVSDVGDGPNGLIGFGVTMAFRDEAIWYYWWSTDLIGICELPYEESQLKAKEACIHKRDEFVKLWKGENQ